MVEHEVTARQLIDFYNFLEERQETSLSRLVEFFTDPPAEFMAKLSRMLEGDIVDPDEHVQAHISKIGTVLAAVLDSCDFLNSDTFQNEFDMDETLVDMSGFYGCLAAAKLSTTYAEKESTAVESVFSLNLDRALAFLNLPPLPGFDGSVIDNTRAYLELAQKQGLMEEPELPGEDWDEAPENAPHNHPVLN